jgi:hypothetical protein
MARRPGWTTRVSIGGPRHALAGDRGVDAMGRRAEPRIRAVKGGDCRGVEMHRRGNWGTRGGNTRYRRRIECPRGGSAIPARGRARPEWRIESPVTGVESPWRGSASTRVVFGVPGRGRWILRRGIGGPSGGRAGPLVEIEGPKRGREGPLMEIAFLGRRIAGPPREIAFLRRGIARPLVEGHRSHRPGCGPLTTEEPASPRRHRPGSSARRSCRP